MSRWYRAYEGTVTDAKLHEAAEIAGASRALVIAIWHSILESCAAAQSCAYGTNSRRISVTLNEPSSTVDAVLSALTQLGMIVNGTVAAWSKRQFASDTSTDRVRKHREAVRNVSETFPKRDCNAPETEQKETEQKERASLLSEPVAAAPARTKPVAKYSEQFESFWKAYPTDPNMSKSKAYDAWVKLGAEDRTGAVESVPAFVRYCRAKPDYRPVHAVKYITDRRFDGFLAMKTQPSLPLGGSQTDASRWPGMLQNWKRGTWSGYWGPEPGTAGCKIPAEFVADWEKSQRVAA